MRTEQEVIASGDRIVADVDAIFFSCASCYEKLNAYDGDCGLCGARYDVEEIEFDAEPELPREAFVQCCVEPTAMDHELLVTVHGVMTRCQILVSRQDVLLSSGHIGAYDAVRVRVHDEDQASLLVELPGVLVLGVRMVWVERHREVLFDAT